MLTHPAAIQGWLEHGEEFEITAKHHKELKVEALNRPTESQCLWDKERSTDKIL